jgi:hypothetical protein
MSSGHTDLLYTIYYSTVGILSNKLLFFNNVSVSWRHALTSIYSCQAIYHIFGVTIWTMTRSYLQFNMLFGLHYGSWQRSYLKFNMLFELHYRSWQRSYLQFNMLFGLHYRPWQGPTYNLTCCLGYIMDLKL